MEIKRTIKGDLDNIYDNGDAEVVNIFSYICSKGDLESNKLTNKFYNIEILKYKHNFYYVVTSGALGGNKDNVVVKRIQSETIIKKLYLEECKKKESQGYTKVEVVSIYPHCSASAKNFVQDKRVISKQEAQEIKDNSTVKIEKLVKSSKEAEIVLDKNVKDFVKNIYLEANQTIKNFLSAESFKDDNNVFGTLSLNMIRKGKDILKDIAILQNKLAIEKGETKKLMQGIVDLSNKYNMTIPRKLDRSTRDWLLETPDKLAEQFDLLELMEVSLSNAVLTSRTVSDIERQYKALNCDIKLVTDKSILNSIKEKMKIEQLYNHHERVKLLNVFEINQKNAPTFNGGCGNVVSLFHGTRAANLVSILSTSIKLPANLGANVAITGRMFGAGVYFGQFSKALQYSVAKFGGTQNKGNRSYLFLCDVALGKMKFEPFGKNYAQAPTGYNSVMGVGEDAFKEGCYIKGIGEIKDFNIPASVFHREVHSRGHLLHNEYIVYNQTRYRIRYVIEVERE